MRNIGRFIIVNDANQSSLHFVLYFLMIYCCKENGGGGREKEDAGVCTVAVSGERGTSVICASAFAVGAIAG